jgi:hypothetical protein
MNLTVMNLHCTTKMKIQWASNSEEFIHGYMTAHAKVKKAKKVCSTETVDTSSKHVH